MKRTYNGNDFNDFNYFNSSNYFNSYKLKHIKHLFFYLFQFILHLHHDVLHLGLIALAACGVDFASHLLGYEAELLALAYAVVHGLAEIFQMVGKALFFLVDVEFLYVIDKLLLKTVLVVFYFRYALQALYYAAAYLLNARLLIRLYRCQQGCYVVELLTELVV